MTDYRLHSEDRTSTVVVEVTADSLPDAIAKAGESLIIHGIKRLGVVGYMADNGVWKQASPTENAQDLLKDIWAEHERR